NRAAAEAVGWEVAALYTNGPSGGAGDFSSVREILAVQSVLLARDLVPTRIKLIETR
ncbi:MAG: ABC transporter substrate-binding protein, partial [Rhodospirillaceae bacterium]|nr:ABC transporter substrate-binding protein [Rhodospirillaceae bacterium]